ncbi:hypothetical protein QUF72_15450 [Desulfobacterales bacterium HSG2]|nr:hypothetical protein [Desulfobacterales bacterium HSG2]
MQPHARRKALSSEDSSLSRYWLRSGQCKEAERFEKCDPKCSRGIAKARLNASDLAIRTERLGKCDPEMLATPKCSRRIAKSPAWQPRNARGGLPNPPPECFGFGNPNRLGKCDPEMLATPKCSRGIAA